MNRPKHYIKIVIPDAWVRSLDGIRQRVELNLSPSVMPRTDNLADLDVTALSALLCSPEIDEDWASANPDIVPFLPQRDVGWAVCPGERRALYYYVRGMKAASVLEIGTHVGGSTLHIVAALRRMATADYGGVAPHLTTVDIVDVNDPVVGPWRTIGLRFSPRDMMRSFRSDHLVTFVKKPALEYLIDCTETFDLVFLDGSHNARDVYREIAAASRLLRPNGAILLHDVYPELAPIYPGLRPLAGPYLAVERLKREQPSLDYLPLRTLPWPTKMGTNNTTLCLVVRSDRQPRTEHAAH